MGDEMEETASGRLIRSNKAGTAQTSINDQGFWGRVSTYVHITNQIYKILRR